MTYVPCPYTCADKHAPCADVAPETVSTSRMVKEARALKGVMQPRTVTSPCKCRVAETSCEQEVQAWKRTN